MKDTYAIEHVAGYAILIDTVKDYFHHNSSPENKILVEIRTIVISLYA